MAISGCALFIFVIAHLIGNLQFFSGNPDTINHYGHFLQTNWEIKWPARIGLLIMVVLHIASAVKLTAENRAARGAQGYAEWKPAGASYASRTMMMSGIIIAAFIVYHLMHYTVTAPKWNFTGQDFGTFTDREGRHDIYKMMIVGFSNGWVSLFYIIAMGLLCLHLSHGASAMFQSLGWKKGYYKPLLDNGAKLIAILIFAGYVMIPIAILLGYGKDYVSKQVDAGPARMTAPGGVR
jgi:succinate dehydrogenase / fumarate reductase cytochrome b subunit